MKSTIILSFILAAAAITAAQAASSGRQFAQAGAEAPPAAATAPAEQPAVQPASAEAGAAQPVPAETVPAQPAPAAVEQPKEEKKAAPVAQPSAPAEAPKRAAAAQGSQKQPHTDFASMEIRECTECHAGQGVAMTHGAFWVREHRVVAANPGKNCKDCHNQSFCLDCHTGGGIDVDLNTLIVRAGTAPLSHRTDFREIHPLKALQNPQTCYRCHNPVYCSECHAKFRGEDLRVQSHRRSWSDLKTGAGPAHSTFTTGQCQTCHPGGVLPKTAWSADHAREARRNLQACQTCHSDGEVCMTCHSSRSGLRVSPHPRNWSAVKDNFRKKSDGRSCVKCHDNY